jgi:hydroxypyruvate isomerase
MYAMGEKNFDLEGFLKEIKSIGFSAIEYWSRDQIVPFEESAEKARSLGLRVASMVGHEHETQKDGSHAEGFSRRKNHDRLEQELRESIDIAARLDMAGIITLSGHRNPHESDYQSLLVCAEGLKRVAPYAEEKGVNLNMEILNTTVDHPHYLCDNVDWTIALCEMVNSPRVKILFDIYHVQIMEGNIIRNIKKAAPWTGHYHTAGNPGRHELDDLQELHYPGIARAIASTGYELFVGHEFIPTGDPLKSLSQAFKACQI